MPISDLIASDVIRLTHKSGAFAAEYDWRRGVVRFVERGGTVDYDLVAIAREMTARQTLDATRQEAEANHE